MQTEESFILLQREGGLVLSLLSRKVISCSTNRKYERNQLMKTSQLRHLEQ